MPYVFQLSDLPKLDLQVDRSTDFEAWRAQWTSYATLSGLSGESEATKVQALTLCFSRETLTVVNNLGLTEEERANASVMSTDTLTSLWSITGCGAECSSQGKVLMTT